MRMDRCRRWLDRVAAKREGLGNAYFWCKAFAMVINTMYMVRTFGSMYRTIDEVSQAYNQQDKAYQWLTIQSVFRILMGTLSTLCLIIDLFVLASRDILVASWYWRPGLFFFTLNCFDEAVTLFHVLLNSDRLRVACHSRVFSTSAPNPLAFEVCDLDMRVTQLWYMLTALRDFIESILYVAAGHVYLNHRRQTRTRRIGTPTAMGPLHSSRYAPNPAWSDTHAVVQAPRHAAVP